MGVFRTAFSFYINSSIHVALSVLALASITLIQFEQSYYHDILLLLFFGTIAAYNFVKYYGLVKFHHRKLANWLKAIQIISVFSFFSGLYFATRLNQQALVLIFVLGMITFLYAIPILPRKLLLDEHRNLRQISGLKVYVIALVWALATVLLPILNLGIDISTDVILTCFQRFLFVLVLMLPFEIRDLNFDNLKLATIPQRIGIRKTKLIGAVLLVGFVCLDFFKDELSVQGMISTVIIAFVTLIFLINSRKNQSKFYSAFWVESIPLVWLGLLLILG